MTAVTESEARRERLFETRGVYQSGWPGYSRLVRSLRLILPLLAAALLVLAMIWPSLDWKSVIVGDDLDISVDPRDVQELRMRSARLVGADETGQPYQVSATQARQGENGLDVVILDQPAGEIVLDDGATLTVSAERGHYNRNAESLELSGAVVVEHGNGYKFLSDSAVVDISDNRASGYEAVEGIGPEGRIEGEGFEILDKGRTVKILGKSRLTVTSVPEQQ